MTPLESLHWFLKMMDKIHPSIEPLTLHLMMQWALWMELLFLNSFPSNHVFDYVFGDIIIFYGVANDPMVKAILRIICPVDFGRSFGSRREMAFTAINSSNIPRTSSL